MSDQPPERPRSEALRTSLGEGGTPLIDAGECRLKCEQLNPTGSFKDRIASVALSIGIRDGAAGWVGSSSGNAGIAFSAYGARAGMSGILLVPPTISSVAVAQIEIFGTRIVAVEGFLTDAAVDAAVFAAIQRLASVRHLVLGITAYAFNEAAMRGCEAIAHEIIHQFGRAPAAVFVPIGGGGLVTSLGAGFRECVQLGLAEHPPRLIGVQPSSCAPVHDAFVQGADHLAPVDGGRSSIAGAGLPVPPDGDRALRAIRESGGFVVAVDEQLVHEARGRLARRHGVLVEPAAALAYAGFEQRQTADAVIVLTGRGSTTVNPAAQRNPMQTITADQIETL